MIKKLKRFLAKEILILACTGTLTGIIYLLCLYSSNQFYESHQNELKYNSINSSSYDGYYYNSKYSPQEIEADKEALRIQEKARNQLRDIEQFPFILFAILWFCVYPIRILYYILKWAVRTVKDTEERNTEENVALPKEVLIPKYDLTYKKAIGARVVGIILMSFGILSIMFARIIIILNNIDVDAAIKFYSSFTLVTRIVGIIWVGVIAKRQNRNKGAWGLFGFISPALALIIIGSIKKLNGGGLLEQNLVVSNNNPKQVMKSSSNSENEPENIQNTTERNSNNYREEFDNNLKKLEDTIKELEKNKKK